MAELSAIDTTRAADKIIHDIGAKWMLDKETWSTGRGTVSTTPSRTTSPGGAASSATWYAEMSCTPRRAGSRPACPGHVGGGRRPSPGRPRPRGGMVLVRGLVPRDVPDDPRLCELGEWVVRRRRGVGATLFRRLARPPASQGGPERLTHGPGRAVGTEGGLHLIATTSRVGPRRWRPSSPCTRRAGAQFLGWQGDLPDGGRHQAPAGGGRGDHRRLCAAGTSGRCRLRSPPSSPRWSRRRAVRSSADGPPAGGGQGVRTGRRRGLSPGDKSRPRNCANGRLSPGGLGVHRGPGHRSPSQRSQVMGRPAHRLVRLVRVRVAAVRRPPPGQVSVLAASALAVGAAAVPVSAAKPAGDRDAVASGSPVTEVRESVVRVRSCPRRQGRARRRATGCPICATATRTARRRRRTPTGSSWPSRASWRARAR